MVAKYYQSEDGRAGGLTSNSIARRLPCNRWWPGV